MEDVRRGTKLMILEEHRKSIRQLSNLSRDQLGSFIDQIQMKCPTMAQRDMSNAIEIFAKMELNRTGYDLLQQLVQLSPHDLDSLSVILETWSITDARKVLDELYWRLEIIKKMESLVENPETEELHELQPLFETGLWIFGPEYEAVEFLSNRTLAKVVKKFFGEGELDNPRKRADFVVLPDSSIGVYSSDAYDEDSHVSGIRKVLIIELKRGGSKITKKEARQAEDYALEIRKSGRIQKFTEIVCYVLGSCVDCGNRRLEDEMIVVYPRPYSTVLRQAHARTFNLMQKIRESKGIQGTDVIDDEIREIISQTELDSYLWCATNPPISSPNAGCCSLIISFLNTEFQNFVYHDQYNNSPKIPVYLVIE